MKKILFVWDNFGPMHVDRCEAVAVSVQKYACVVGIEIFGQSDTYEWKSETGSSFRKVTLFEKGTWQSITTFKLAYRIISACREVKASHVFFCHHEKPGILFAASVLRLLRYNVYLMGCSKFDDSERYIWREVAKRFFYMPYQGAISSGKRAKDYIRFMGVKRENIVNEYNTLSIERVRRLAGKASAPSGTPFRERHFTIISRFVPKKNLTVALDAYALYLSSSSDPRPLHLCGSGPLEAELRMKVNELGLTDYVVFRGFLQTDAIARTLSDSLVLLLPSVEEQFGNVVIEAQAMGLPVILSDVCGARDNLVRTGVNGFVVEPDNAEGFAFFMRIISEDENLWSKMSKSASRYAEKGDVRRFADAAGDLIQF